MFRGRYKLSVDIKGRTSIPSKYRDILKSIYGDDRLMITTGFESYLVAYPIMEWEKFEEKVSKLPQFDPKVVSLKRFYISGAVECNVDDHGRILLPSYMREFASIDKEILWVGMLNNIEIWSPVKWDTKEKGISREDLEKSISDLGL